MSYSSPVDAHLGVAAAGQPDPEDAIAAAIDGLAGVAIRSASRDISLTAASTLATLDRNGACRLTDLAEIEGVAQPSMTTLVTGLERAGLAERRPSPDDGRVVLVALTPVGADYLRARRRTRAAKLADLIRQLPPAEAAALADAIPAMVSLRDLDIRRRTVLRDGKAHQDSKTARKAKEPHCDEQPQWHQPRGQRARC